MTSDKTRRSVLIVEDEPGIAKICQRTLVAEGFQVEIVNNGEIGLNMWRNKVYDLCISDIRTPRMSGMELFQRLAAECPDALKKFIFTTGDVLSGNVKEFLEKTGRPYLSKPFTPENLRDVVRKTLIAD